MKKIKLSFVFGLLIGFFLFMDITAVSALNSGTIGQATTQGSLTTLVLSTPNNIVYKSGDDDTITMAWSAVTGATGYNVVLKEAYGISPKTFSMNVTGTTVSFNGLKTTQPYVFSIYAYSGSVKSATTTYVHYLYPRKSLTISRLASWGANYMSVSWDYSSLAEVCVSKYATSGFSCFYSDDVYGNDHMYSFYGVGYQLMYNTTYYFKIRSFYIEDNTHTRIFGNYSPVVSGKTVLGTPEPKISVVSMSSLKLNWPYVLSSNKNYVYRSTTFDGTYSLVYTSTGESTTFIDTNLTVGQEYFYKVRVYNSTTGEYSPYSTVLSAIPEFLAPTKKSVTDLDTDSLRIDLNPIEGATGYEFRYYVYDPLVSDPVFTEILVTTPYVVIDGLEIGNIVVVDVRAYVDNNSTRIFSVDSTHFTWKHSTAIPKLTIVNDYHSASISWNPVDGSDGVEIYFRDASTNNGWQLLVNTSETSYFHENLITGHTYHYYARSYKGYGQDALYSEFSTTAYAPILFGIPKPVITKFSMSTVTLSWDAIPGVEGYTVYKAPAKTHLYEVVGDTTDTTIKITGLTGNTEYYFMVEPFSTDPYYHNRYLGEGQEIKGKTLPFTPVVVASLTNYNTNQLTWASIEDVTGYEIYYSIGSSSTYTFLRTTTTPSTSHTGLITGTRYNYKVRAYKTVNLVKVYGAFSNPVSSVPIPTAPNITVVSSGITSLKVSWPTVAGANGYEVSTSTSSDGPYTVLPLVTATSINIGSLATNQTAFVKVRAYRIVGTTKFYGAFSTPVSAKPIPTTPLMTAVSGGYDRIALSWSAIADATGYELFVYDESISDYVLLSDRSAASYIDTPLVTGVSRTYKVKAYVVINEERIYGLDSISVTATPVPSLVTDFKVTSSDIFTIGLTWNAVTGATGYEISRSSTATGVFSFIANIEEGVIASDSGLSFNQAYFYKVRAYTTVNEVKVYGSLSPVLTTKTALRPVTNPSAVYTAYNANKITWSTVNGATGYEIYRSTGTSTTYAYLTALTGTTYTNTGLYTNSKYNYKIRAYRLVGTVKVYGAFSAIVSATPLPWAPTVTVASSSNTSLKITWPVVAGANGYEVSYSTSETGTYTKLALVTTNSASITKLLTNSTYYVKVRAYRIVNYVKIYGASSTIVTGKPIPSTPLVTAVSAGFSSVRLSWAAITGASGYEVYALTPESSDYFLAADVTTLTATIGRLTSGTVNSFKVRAYQIVNGTRVYSVDSAVKTATPIPSTVTGLKVAMPSITSLKLNWTAVDGATGYELFKATSSTGTYVSLGTVEGSTEFNVTGLTFNTSTYYKVRAYTTVGATKVYGLNTAVLTGKTMPSTVQLSVSNPSYNTNALSWPAIEGATGYEIYVSTGTSTYYTLLKSLTTTSFTHSNLAFNTQYNYKVRAYRLVGTVKYYGAYSTLTSIKTAVSAPSAFVNSTHDSISLTWNTVTGASGYEVSISTSATGPFTVTTQTSISKVFTGLTTGTTYTIKLRSYRLVSTTKVYGPYASVITVTPSLNVPSIQMSELTLNAATLTWAAVDGATDYEARILSDAEGAEWFVESVSELTVTFEDLDPLAHYTVEVRAIKKIAEVPVPSEYSSPIVFSYSDTN